jgi:hypothetical protein
VFASQVSVVHLFPSSQAIGLTTQFPEDASQEDGKHLLTPWQLTGVNTHPEDASQESVVQRLLSLQRTGVLTRFPVKQSQL